MKVRCVLALSTVLALAAVSLAAQLPCDPSSEPLLSNQYYDVISTTEVSFHPDAYFQVVGSASGALALVFLAQQPPPAAAVAAIECRCGAASCTENTCTITGAGSGNARCRGGCYTATGEACVSCRFFTVPPPPPPRMPPAK